MAWWQHPEDQDTPPVTVERITEWYEQQGYKYGVDGDDERQYVVSGFGGFGVIMEITRAGLLRVHGLYDVDMSVSEENRSRLNSVCCYYNENALFPTLYSEADDTGLQIRSDFVIPVGRGANGKQLSSYIYTMLDATLDALRTARLDLGLEPNQEAD